METLPVLQLQKKIELKNLNGVQRRAYPIKALLTAYL